MNATDNKTSNWVSTIIVPLALILAMKIGGPICHEAFGPKLPTYPAGANDPLEKIWQRHQGQLFHRLEGEAAPTLPDAWKQAAERSRLAVKVDQ